MAIIKISDDFDMKKIADSGQCFRAVEVKPGVFRFVTKQSVVYMKQIEPGKFDVSCNVAEWEKTWVEYFDLRTKYAPIREKILQSCAGRPYENYIKEALEFGKGIRILKQEPFEALISFIISQRKNIPSIRSTVEQMCNTFGGYIGTPYEQINFFPSAHTLSHTTMFDMSSLALGYRGAYVRDAIEKVNARAVDLEILQYESDKDLLEILQRIRGVGPKVAACVALYAYHRLNIMPIDVWIQRAIEEDFNGNNIFYEFAEYAGVLQLYIFFYKRLAEKGYWLVG
ncbi:MAG: DNA-3-methyladenine glycosylase 2 family protein [Selenomonadaceae bacterium]|nr:DNA-3-methyladenine glycosylase 2 family protein [Selenomonadaceae bacterium]